MATGFVFDQPHYDLLNSSREATIRQLLVSLRGQGFNFETAADIGCGVGRFASFLRDEGYRTLAIDGRAENVAEAARRCSGVEFRIFDAEDEALRSIGKHDLVLFLGLFYHLENPFAAFRNLCAITGKLAILEGICHPSREPVLSVRDEGSTEDQGLRHVALYPSESGLIKLLYRAGFAHVYRFATLPQHPVYRKSNLREQVRTIVAASFSPLPTDLLKRAEEPLEIVDPWAVRNSPAALGLRAFNAVARAGRFAVKPWPEKRVIMQRRWPRLFPS